MTSYRSTTSRSSRARSPPASLIIATSRRSIAAPDAIISITLQPLDDDAAARLLNGLMAADTEHDSDIVPRLAALTGGLPLGIALLAGQLDADKGWSLEDHAARLESSASSALSPSLAAAYTQLTPGARHALHLIAEYPGRLSDTEAETYLQGAAAAGESPWSVPHALDELTREHFLSRSVGGRYELHDVVRALAVEHARVEEPLSRRRAAARDLSLALVEHLNAETVDAPAIARFNESVEVHVATVALAASHNLAPEVNAHAKALHVWLSTTTRWNDMIVMNEHVRRVATPTDRPGAERRLSNALSAVGRMDEAEIILRNLAASPDPDPDSSATTVMLADIASLRGDLAASIALAQSAIDDARAVKEPRVILWATGIIAQALCDLGRSDEGIDILERALVEFPLHDVPLTRIASIVDLAVTLAWADRLDGAREQLERARGEAITMGHRGLTIFCEGWMGAIDVMEGHVETGRPAIAAADVGLREFSREKPGAWMKYFYADASLAAGDPSTALEFAVMGLALSDEFHFADLSSLFRILIARVAIAEERNDDARSLLEPLLEDNVPRARALACEQLGVLAERAGDRARASAYWNEALAMTPAPFFARAIRARLDAI